MSSLLDQSALTDLADRLVAAARRAGADTADALAVRSVSLAVEVREGAVEESERSEGDDVGLRVFVGTRQAVVSTNDVKTDVAQLAERAVAMARAAPEDPFAALADPAQLARDIPDLDLLDPDLPTVAQLEERAQRAESAGLAVKGVTKSGGASASAGIGGMVLVTSHGFRGAYLNSGQSVSMTAIAGEGTAMERDYDYSSAIHGTDLEPPEKVGRTAGERTVERINPRKVETRRVPVVFDRRVAGSLVGHLASAINAAAVARKTSFLKDKLGDRLFKPGINIIDDPRRLRGLRSRPFDAEGVMTKRLAVVEDGVSSTPSPGPSNLHLSAGTVTPDALMADIADGFYVTDLIGMGVNQVTGDYSRGASGFWIENGKRTYPVSEVTIAGNLIDLFKALSPANDLEFRFGTNAPTVRVEGLTVGGL
jgi:PmbA protein